MLNWFRKYIWCRSSTTVLFLLVGVICYAFELVSAPEPAVSLDVAIKVFGLGMVLILCLDVRSMNFGRTICYVLGHFVGLAALLLWMLRGPYYLFDASRSSFDSAKWKASLVADDNTPIRLRMVDDLTKRTKLIGMSKSEVDALLGRPPSTDYFRAYDYVYWLGPERGFFSIDSEWLCLKFKNNIVTEARIMRD